MNNTRNKNNARTGGAVTSPQNRLEFINTGHAAQARYLAALANPFASPAVPIPDSFLTAHVSKAGFETVIPNCRALRLVFHKTYDEPTGDYKCNFESWNGSTWTLLRSYSSEVGARLVAAGIAYEDASAADSIGGVVTYTQQNDAFNGLVGETIDSDQRTERNRGDGAVVYELMRRQALEFEGYAHTKLSIEFSAGITVVAKFAALFETDGLQGFTESRASSKDFLITSSYLNHHAGVFADIPMPAYDQSLIPISHTAIEIDGNGTHQGALSAAAHWVATAAGWAWKHKDSIGKVVNRLPQYYHAAVNYGGSIVSHTGQILALGARAAPLMLGA
jgi:hypothetical protein